MAECAHSGAWEQYCIVCQERIKEIARLTAALATMTEERDAARKQFEDEALAHHETQNRLALDVVPERDALRAELETARNAIVQNDLTAGEELAVLRAELETSRRECDEGDRLYEAAMAERSADIDRQSRYIGTLQETLAARDTAGRKLYEALHRAQTVLGDVREQYLDDCSTVGDARSAVSEALAAAPEEWRK